MTALERSFLKVLQNSTMRLRKADKCELAKADSFAPHLESDEKM